MVFNRSDKASLRKVMLQLKDPALREQLMAKGTERVKKFSTSAFINQFHKAVLQQLND